MKIKISHTDLESVQYQRWMDKTNMLGFQDGSINEGKANLHEVIRMLVAYENLARAFGESWSEVWPW